MIKISCIATEFEPRTVQRAAQSLYRPSYSGPKVAEANYFPRSLLLTTFVEIRTSAVHNVETQTPAVNLQCHLLRRFLPDFRRNKFDAHG